MKRAASTKLAAALGALLVSTGVMAAVAAHRAPHTVRASVGSHGVQANGPSIRSSISARGRFVAFDSSATNLVGGDTNGTDDVFVRDRRRGTTKRVSVGSHGAQGDGRSRDP